MSFFLMKPQFFPINENEDARQPETRAVMNWMREIKFTASATLHGVVYFQFANIVSLQFLIIFVLYFLEL